MREIDALGGVMGHCGGRHLLQSRMLNLGKGPGGALPAACRPTAGATTPT
ncbi:MAG: FAD-dependent oxidoreductase [Oscillospiraceae bacterium]